MISIHLEGKALKWHLNFMKTRKDDEISRETYLSHMEARFSDAKHINPMVQLKQLHQVTSVDEYIEAFDDLLTELDIPEQVAMDCFLGGLHLDVQSTVHAFKPPNLPNMMQMARIQERMITAWRRPNFSTTTVGHHMATSTYPFPASGYSSSSHYQPPSSRGSLSAPMPLAPTSVSSTTAAVKKPSISLSKKDMEDRHR